MSISLSPSAKGQRAKIISAALTLALCLAGNCVASSPARQSNEGVADWATVQQLVQSFKDVSSASAKQKPGPQGNNVPVAHNWKVSAGLIDFPEIARRSAGTQWQAMNAGQRQELSATIESLIKNRYFPRWEKIFGKGEVTYVSQSRKSGDIMVATNLKLGSKNELLTFQLAAPTHKVVSLSVNEKDLLTRLSQRIQAQQAKGGYEGMMAWLKAKGGHDIADSGEGESNKVSAKPVKTSMRAGDGLL